MRIKIKKIITAINNPSLNEKLKKEKDFEIVGKDLLYKEAILEILEEDKNIDIIILSENLMGEIEIEKLIKKIKDINEKIKIIFIVEKKDANLNEILIKNKIIDIYDNNNLNELIKIINKKEVHMDEEIIKLERNKKEENIKKQENAKVKDGEIKKKKISKKQIIKNMLTKIITFSGNHQSGKTMLSLITSWYASQKSKKTLLIDTDLNKQDLSLILKKFKKYKIRNQVKYKICFCNKYKRLKNIERNIYYYKIKKELNFFTIKINENLYFFNGLKDILKNNEKIINIFFDIIQKEYEIIVVDLSKENLENINKYFLEKSFINFILLEATLLGIKQIKKLLELYIEKWNVNIKNIKIISNKKDFLSINKILIQKSIPIKNKILEIKKNNLYSIIINQLFKDDNLVKNMKIKKDMNIIFKEIKN